MESLFLHNFSYWKYFSEVIISTTVFISEQLCIFFKQVLSSRITFDCQNNIPTLVVNIDALVVILFIKSAEDMVQVTSSSAT